MVFRSIASGVSRWHVNINVKTHVSTMAEKELAGVILSDESRFQLFTTDCRVSLYRYREERTPCSGHFEVAA